MLKSIAAEDPVLTRLTDAELLEIRLRLSQAESAGSPDRLLIKNISEATGVPAERILDHLKRMRAENSFGRAATGTRIHVLEVVGGAVLVLAGLWTWIKISQAQEGVPLVAYRGRALQMVPTEIPPKVSSRKRPPQIPIQNYGYGGDQEQIPQGFNLTMISPTRYVSVMGNGGSEIKTMDFGAERDALAAALGDLLNGDLPRFAANRPQPPISGTFTDNSGNQVTIKPGEAYFGIAGWAGDVHGYVPLPLTSAGESRLKEAAAEILEPWRKQQEEGMRTDLPPGEGIILPPPRVEVLFTGRRVDIQHGPRLSFTIHDKQSIVRRILLAVRNAFERDRKPPIGPWNRSAEQEAKIPNPIQSHVEMSTGSTTESFEIPSSDEWNSEDEKIVSKRAEKIADQIVGK